jgi:type IX secretion system PorP/SprF family membrane protein
MKKTLLTLIVFTFSMQMLFAQQENGVVSFDIPAKSSLKFNKFLINPTFSFVREQHSSISFFNKRQWIEFENAPQTYLLTYSGKANDKSGVSVGLFQQNYGVLTTFGGLANYAYNVSLSEKSNLTFGFNVGYYNSGLNYSKTVVNSLEPSLPNVPSNAIITANPGINLGIGAFDIGFSANNLVLYNLQNSKMVADDPSKTIEGHLMFTGISENEGFFEKSKFSILAKAEKAKDKLNYGGAILYDIPKALWLQGSYDTFYGISAGAGINLSKKIAVGYAYEKGLGNLANFGVSHQITFAYTFRNTEIEDNDMSFIPAKKMPQKEKDPTATKSGAQIKKEQDAKLAELAKAKAAEEAKLKSEITKPVEPKKPADVVIKTNETPPVITETKPVKEIKTKAQLKAEAIQKQKEAALAIAQADAEAKAEKIRIDKQNAEAKQNAAKITKEKQYKDAKANAASEKLRLEKEAAMAKTKVAEEAKAEKTRIEKETAEAKIKAANKAKANAAAEKLRLEKEAAIAKTKASEEAKAEKTRIEKETTEAKIKAANEAKANAAKTNAAAEKLRLEKEAAMAKTKAAEEAKAEKIRIDKEAAEAKIKAANEAKANAAAEKLRLEKEAAIAKIKAAEDAKAEKLRLEKEAAIAKTKAAEDAKAEKLRLEKEAIKTAELSAQDDIAKNINALNKNLENGFKNENQSLFALDSISSAKEKDLKDIKEENDLGGFKEPNAFKSGTATNKAIKQLKQDLDDLSKTQNRDINKLEGLYKDRLKKVADKNDATNIAISDNIEKYKLEQAKIEAQKSELISKIEEIKVQTEIEKKRRIKLAISENSDSRYTKDRETLNAIRANTPKSNKMLTISDFDFGDVDQSGIQIFKNIENLQTGYYLVLAAHKDTAKRDEFLTKTVASGQPKIDFFYNVEDTKYYVFFENYATLNDAQRAFQQKGNKPYNAKMVIVKIENER